MYIKRVPKFITDPSTGTVTQLPDTVVLGSMLKPSDTDWFEYTGDIPFATVHEWDNATNTVVPSEEYTTGIKKDKLTEIASSYESANESDILYMDTSFQTDAKSQNLIVAVLSAGSLPAGFFWLDATNAQIPMSYVELQGLSGSILSRNQSNFIKYQDLKAQISTAATQADLDLIVW